MILGKDNIERLPLPVGTSVKTTVRRWCGWCVLAGCVLLGRTATANEWKVVCGGFEGPEGRASELLTAEVGEILLRDPGVYATRVLPVLAPDELKDSTNLNLIVVGTRADNPILRARVRADEVPAGGYLVRAFQDGGRKVALLAGDTPAAALWAAVDFVDDGIGRLRPDRGNGLLFVRDVFEDRLPWKPGYESRRAPKTNVRSVFTWGHPINDFREYVRNLARMKINRVYLWNNEPPRNAREVVDYAHSWGIEVFWGFSWGWDTQREKTSELPNEEIAARVLETWRTTWSKLPGDGIYFQTFTEMRKKTVNGESVAAKAVRLVNSVADKVLAERPGLKIVFGLHATSVFGALDDIAATDPRLEILWEDCGAFPFGYWVKTTEREDDAFVDRLLADERHPVGLVYKWMMIQDWTHFTFQQGPYCLGVTSRRTHENDMRLQAELWKNFTVDWERKGARAHALARRVQAKGPQVELNMAAQLNGPLHFPAAFSAELFWSADEDFATIRDRVLNRANVIR